MARCIAKHWLDKHKYIAELEDPKCLAVVTIDDSGKIVRCAIFGDDDEGGGNEV